MRQWCGKTAPVPTCYGIVNILFTDLERAHQSAASTPTLATHTCGSRAVPPSLGPLRSHDTPLRERHMRAREAVPNAPLNARAHHPRLPALTGTASGMEPLEGPEKRDARGGQNCARDTSQKGVNPPDGQVVQAGASGKGG